MSLLLITFINQYVGALQEKRRGKKSKKKTSKEKTRIKIQRAKVVMIALNVDGKKRQQRKVSMNNGLQKVLELCEMIYVKKKGGLLVDL